MEPNTLLVIGLICLGLGVFIGLLLGNLFRGNQKTVIPPERANKADIIRIWRKPGDKFGIYIGDRNYDTPGDIPPSVASKVHKMVNHLLQNPDQPPVGGLSDILSDGLAEIRILDSEGNAGITYSDEISEDRPESLAIDESIASQIDAVLQEKLASIKMTESGVRLFEIPGKGMVVMVGLEQYDDLDSVPDEQIRNIIKDAVKEWEKK